MPSLSPVHSFGSFEGRLQQLLKLVDREPRAFDERVERSALQVAVVPGNHHGAIIRGANEYLVATALPVFDNPELA